MMSRTRLGWVIVAAISAFTMFSATVQSPDLSSDAATCILSAVQLENGTVTEWHTLSTPDSKDLRKDRTSYLSWWPSSYETLPFLFRGMSMSWGAAVKSTFAMAWLVGAVGWVCLFRRFVNQAWLPWIAAAMLLCRYSHNNASVYNGGEYLFWSMFPWVALCNITLCLSSDSLMKTTAPVSRLVAAVFAGLVTPLLICVKFSGALSVVGFAAGWLFLTLRRHCSFTFLVAWAAGATISCAVTLLPTLATVNPASVRDGWHFGPLVWGWGAWTLAMTDVEILLMKLFVHREPPLLSSTGNYGDGHLLWLIPGICLICVGAWATRPRKAIDVCCPILVDDSVKRVAQLLWTHLAVFTVVLCVLIATGSKIHMDARFLRPAAIAVFPFVVDFLWRGWNCDRTAHRVLCLVGALFLLAGVAYGGATLSYKTLVLAPATRGQVSQVGLRHQLLDSSGDTIGFIDEVSKQMSQQRVVYLIDHALAIPLAEHRTIVEHAASRGVEELRSRVYRNVPQEGILLVLPNSFDANGKTAAIKESFGELTWSSQPSLSQPQWQFHLGKP